jgi:hypothetical protein
MGWLFVLISSTWLSVGALLCKPGLKPMAHYLMLLINTKNCLIILVLSQYAKHELECFGSSRTSYIKFLSTLAYGKFPLSRVELHAKMVRPYTKMLKLQA